MFQPVQISNHGRYWEDEAYRRSYSYRRYQLACTSYQPGRKEKLPGGVTLLGAVLGLEWSNKLHVSFSLALNRLNHVEVQTKGDNYLVRGLAACERRSQYK
jgi:hypothetical protein